ncbi:MAG: methyl-accepting chemotaxis protein [Steroidobacteraceae bacterium]
MMTWLESLKVSRRLMVLGGTCLLLMIASGLFALGKMRGLNEISSDINDNWLPGIEYASGINTAIGDFRAAELQHVLSVDASDMTRYEGEMASVTQAIEEYEKDYEKIDKAADEQATWDDFKKTWSAFMLSHARMLQLSRANKNDEARALARGESQTLYDEASSQLDRLVEINSKGGNAATALANSTYKSSVYTVWGALLCAVVLASWLILCINRSIVGAINTAVKFAREISNGAIGNGIDVPARASATELGQLLEALRSMDEKLCEIVGVVSTTADSVGTAARQISQGNDDLSQRTQEQASALEETAATMEEMTATVKRNSDNAYQADQLGRQARTQADDSTSVVQRAVAAMADINTSSRKIADIINVIDEIAFQTNLLALNAAVEAARAGEQGRGFAVVASEVRNLAQRSASAAKEIKSLIHDSVDKVNNGTELVNASGQALNNIVGDVKRVTDIVAEIAAASAEQASGIDQINTAVTQMDNTTQQNAALVEEAASASKAMEQQATDLVERVNFFRVKGATQVSMSTASTSARVTQLQPKLKPVRNVSAPRSVKVSGGDNTWTEF